MWYCKACEKNINIHSKSSHSQSTAQTKILFGTKSDFTDRKNKFGDPGVYQLDNLFEENTGDYMQNFHRFSKQMRIQTETVREKKGKDGAYFTKTSSGRSLYDPINEQNDINVKIQENERKESGFIV